MTITIIPLHPEAGMKMEQISLWRPTVSARLMISTPTQGIHVQAVLIIREALRISVFDRSTINSLGITVVCAEKATTPESAFLWSVPNGLSSPLSLPTTFIAQVVKHDLQPLLDMAVDLCADGELAEALRETERRALILRSQCEMLDDLHNQKEIYWQKCLAALAEHERPQLEMAAGIRLRKLDSLKQRLRDQSECAIVWVAFVNRLLERRRMSESDRQAELQLHHRIDALMRHV